MGETITIRTGAATEVIKVIEQGPQGPAGPAGTGLETLTTQGDMLYRDASGGQRLSIGTAGQILKVNSGGTAPEWGAAPASGVTSVNGQTGAVTVAAVSHSHQPSAIYCDAADVADTTLSSGEPNGIYFRDGSDNGKAIYKSSQGYAIWWDDGEEEWVLGNLSQSQKYYIGTGNTEYPWQATSWALGPQGSGDTPVVDQALLSNFQRNAAQDSVSTRTPKTGNASSTEVVLGSDTRLTNSRTPASHTHGNLTNAGAVGTTANLPLRTGTNGVVEAGSFGTAAGSFCEGNDARLSDARTPSSTLAHKTSHSIGGTDALAPSDIGAQSIFVTESLSLTTSAEVTLTAARAKILSIVNFSGSDVDVVLPQTGNQVGDTFVFRWGTGGNQVLVRPTSGGSPVTSVTSGQQVRVIRAASSWDVVNVDTHFHNANQITGGTLDVARLPVGTGSTQVAAGNHTHVVADVAGAAASGSITTSGLTQATARILGRTTASTGAVEEITIGSGLSLSAGELSSTVSAGIPATLLDAKGDLIVASAADTAARLAVGGTNGHLLTVDSAETLGVKWAAAAGGGSGGTKTYAVFTATDNQPPSTAFATLDTRNSIAVLDFDAATDESAVFVGVIPEGASLGSGLKVFIHWMASTATSGNCRWGVQFEKSGTDLDTDSFDTATEAHSAANGTSGIETVTEITATAIDSLAAGNRFRLKVFRNADDATNDTMTGDAELIAVEVRSAA